MSNESVEERVENPGLFVEPTDKGLLVFDRDKKEFVYVESTRDLVNDAPGFFGHVRDLWHITRKYGVRRAISYERKTTQAHVYDILDTLSVLSTD